MARLDAGRALQFRQRPCHAAQGPLGRACRLPHPPTSSRSNAPSTRRNAICQPLDNFIHPGGSLPGAYLHLARTICRRAERQLIGLRESDDGVSIETQHFVNRLSDALFVWSRWINADLNEPEYLWNSGSDPATVKKGTIDARVRLTILAVLAAALLRCRSRPCRHRYRGRLLAARRHLRSRRPRLARTLHLCRGTLRIGRRRTLCCAALFATIDSVRRGGCVSCVSRARMLCAGTAQSARSHSASFR